MFPNVQDALHRRLDALQDSNWVEWMVALIGRKENQDISGGTTQEICNPWSTCNPSSRLQTVCRIIKFWLPTREIGLMRQFVRLHGPDAIPDNLTIRVSAAMVAGDAVSIDGCHTSRVDAHGTCPSTKAKQPMSRLSCLLGLNRSTVLPIPYTDMIKDLICAICGGIGFVLIWILAAII